MLDDWGPDVLEDALAARQRPVKSVLMDQARLAGLGNIQATEALFGRNDFFPFTRAELEKHDPAMSAMVARMWGVE